MKRIFQNQKSFALIYVLLFIVLLLIAVSATWLTGMADLRLSQRSEYSVQAMQLAKAGIDDGWIKYKSDIGDTYPLPNVSYPTNSCDPNFTSKVARINPNVSPLPGPTPTDELNPPPSLSETIEGRYDYRICTDMPAAGKTTIEGIGYYKGSKVTLKAEVNHDGDLEYCDGGVANDEITCESPPISGTWKINHDDDYITIYQSGPSK